MGQQIMKAIAYYEGHYNHHRGKFLNAILKYKKEILAGVYCKEPAESLREYLATNNIKLLTELADIPADCTHFVLTLLDFPSWDIIYSNVEPSLKYCAQKNIKIINGTFKIISDRYPQYKDQIYDIRKQDPDYQPEHFKDQLRKKTEQLRILTVGTDSTAGKMTAGLELEKGLHKKGYDAKFIATGQIGIFLTGDGIPLDATIIDFSRGMLEDHLLKHDNKILIVEGQGSIFHPVFFGTATTLLYGSVAQLMILCGHPLQKTIRTVKYWPIPDYAEVIRKTEETARVVCPESKIVALTLNTSEFDEKTALDQIKAHEDKLGLPVTDVVRFGPDKLVTAVENAAKKYLTIDKFNALTETAE